ncbi:hypothetical protein B0H19DRAFT_1250547 [Mycena capillaripes]|nr:hypothetical protein B0H19DRAFT_1250547 [Mycena capillaripes]
MRDLITCLGPFQDSKIPLSFKASSSGSSDPGLQISGALFATNSRLTSRDHQYVGPPSPTRPPFNAYALRHNRILLCAGTLMNRGIYPGFEHPAALPLAHLMSRPAKLPMLADVRALILHPAPVALLPVKAEEHTHRLILASSGLALPLEILDRVVVNGTTQGFADLDAVLRVGNPVLGIARMEPGKARRR